MMFFTRFSRFIPLFIHLFYTTFQMLYGAWRISKLPGKIVTIFGSSRIRLDTPYAKKAHELSQRFLRQDISILTGGGPGIMEAASCKLKNAGNAKSIGIGVKGLEDRPLQCMSEYFELEYFFARKWLLTQYSSGFVIFPGGFGTLDEMAGVLTLIQTKYLKRVPVVLIGREYWDPFMQWIEKEALVHGAIVKEELDFFYITDNLDDAFCWIVGKCDILQRPSA
jgi:uncharacterized protein (TIGR00730 family)